MPCQAEETLAILCKDEAAAVVEDLQKLAEDPDLFAALRQREFVQTGLELIDGPQCPLCDTEWEIDFPRPNFQHHFSPGSGAVQRPNAMEMPKSLIRGSDQLLP